MNKYLKVRGEGEGNSSRENNDLYSQIAWVNEGLKLWELTEKVYFILSEIINFQIP